MKENCFAIWDNLKMLTVTEALEMAKMGCALEVDGDNHCVYIKEDKWTKKYTN